jgi:aminoglycoside phosphotransferase (APT) family kinase protein
VDLPVKPVEGGGWDNRTFHLGEHLIVRLPNASEYSSQVKKEQFWLPKLEPLLPLPIPAPIAMGKPAEGYPWHWSIIGGLMAKPRRLRALQIYANLPKRWLNFWSLCNRSMCTILGDKIDANAVTEVWNVALTSTWRDPPVWVHGDVAIGNLLVEKRKLSAVIDYRFRTTGRRRSSI